MSSSSDRIVEFGRASLTEQRNRGGDNGYYGADHRHPCRAATAELHAVAAEIEGASEDDENHRQLQNHFSPMSSAICRRMSHSSAIEASRSGKRYPSAIHEMRGTAIQRKSNVSINN